MAPSRWWTHQWQWTECAPFWFPSRPTQSTWRGVAPHGKCIHTSPRLLRTEWGSSTSSQTRRNWTFCKADGGWPPKLKRSRWMSAVRVWPSCFSDEVCKPLAALRLQTWRNERCIRTCLVPTLVCVWAFRNWQNEDTLWRQHYWRVIMFPNVSSFCHARDICVRHKFCVLDTKMFLKIFRNTSCVRAARNNVTAFCHGRATWQDTMLPPQVSSFARTLVHGRVILSDLSYSATVPQWLRGPQFEYQVVEWPQRFATHRVYLQSWSKACGIMWSTLVISSPTFVPQMEKHTGSFRQSWKPTLPHTLPHSYRENSGTRSSNNRGNVATVSGERQSVPCLTTRTVKQQAWHCSCCLASSCPKLSSLLNATNLEP